MKVGRIPRLRRAPLAVAVLALWLVAACGSAATPTAVPTPTAPAQLQSGNDLVPILATTVLHVGDQRVAFLLTSPQALIKVPEVEVTSVFLAGGETPVETKRARFHAWPYGVRGSYVMQLNLDRAGPWRLDIKVDHEDTRGETHVFVDVEEQTGVPHVGAVPPLSRNKTLQTVGSIEKLTTAYAPDPDLYQITVEEAVTTGLPTVVVFASPAFCTSPTCGPQTETVSQLKQGYQEQANFIHIEIYDNPDLIQGDLNQAKLTQAVQDWGISAIPGWFNESWTFVLDPEGRVTQRFEGFATLDELEQALQAVLAQT